MTTVEEYAAQPRSARLQRLTRTADELHTALASVGAASPTAGPTRRPDVLTRRPAPGAWAPVEVVCHLRDTEEWFLTRCRWAIEMEEPWFPRNNPDRWATDRQYLRHDTTRALESFRRCRDDALAFFAALSDDAWSRGGVHLDSRGRRTLDQFLSTMAWHDDNHAAQLVRALDGRP